MLEIALGFEYEIFEFNKIGLTKCSILFPEYSVQIQLVVDGQKTQAVSELLKFAQNEMLVQFLLSLNDLIAPHVASTTEQMTISSASDLNTWQEYSKAGYRALSSVLKGDQTQSLRAPSDIIISRFATADSDDLVSSEREPHKKMTPSPIMSSSVSEENISADSNSLFKLIFFIISLVLFTYFLSSWYPILGLFFAFYILPQFLK